MTQLENLLQQCTVKLTLPDRMGWGTGFFVAPQWILTCAHVVQEVGHSVQVQWQKRELEAVVERSQPDPYDLALLRVTLPIDANPPCVYLDEEIQSRDPLYLFGYPDQDFPNGCPVTFSCEGLTGDEPALIKFALGQVRPGMSGSPLLNQRTRKVCGIVKFTRDRSIDLGGGAISTHMILEQFPQLRGLQQEFHQVDRRWSDLKFDALLTQIKSGGETETDLRQLHEALANQAPQIRQLGKYNISIDEGREIHIGDRTCVEIDGEAIQKIVEAIQQSSSTMPSSIPIQVDSSQARQTVKKILMLSANTEDAETVCRKNQIRKIREALSRAKQSSQFDLENRPEIGVTDLSQELSAIEPYAIDIYGRRNGIETLVSENGYENTASENSEKLIAKLFRLHAQSIECVILNGCYLEEQAREVVQYIEFVIGINQNLKDSEALVFLNEFYFHLGSGRTVKDSYDLGCYPLEQNGCDDTQLPILLDKQSEIKRRGLEKELSSCNEEIEKNPNNATLWKKKADILKDLNRPEEMDEAYEKASSLDPNNYKIRTKQGDALEQFKKHEKSVKAYDKALELDPNNYKIWWKKGQALDEAGKYDEAMESYNKAIALEPPSPDNYVICREYGFILKKVGQYQKSIILYEESLDFEPRYRASNYEKRQVHKKMYSQKG